MECPSLDIFRSHTVTTLCQCSGLALLEQEAGPGDPPCSLPSRTARSTASDPGPGARCRWLRRAGRPRGARPRDAGGCAGSRVPSTAAGSGRAGRRPLGAGARLRAAGGVCDRRAGRARHAARAPPPAPAPGAATSARRGQARAAQPWSRSAGCFPSRATSSAATWATRRPPSPCR